MSGFARKFQFHFFTPIFVAISAPRINSSKVFHEYINIALIRDINLSILRISDTSISSCWKTVNPTVRLIGDKLIENILLLVYR